MTPTELTCEREGCGNVFETTVETKRFCCTTCRVRANRERRAAEESVAGDAAKGKAEHELVKAVRCELEALEQLNTVNGQLALQMARRLTNPNDPNLSPLSKELRSLMADCRAASTAKPPPTGGDEPAGAPQPTPPTPLAQMQARRAAEKQGA